MHAKMTRDQQIEFALETINKLEKTASRLQKDYAAMKADIDMQISKHKIEIRRIDKKRHGYSIEFFPMRIK